MPDSIKDMLLEEIRPALRELVAEEFERRLPDTHDEREKRGWMGKHDVRKHYGLTARQLTYIRSKGTVEYSQHGKRILYNVRSLERWIDEGRVRPKAERTNGNGRGNP